MFVSSNTTVTVPLNKSDDSVQVTLNFSIDDLPTLRKLVAELEKLEKQEQDRKWIEETRALIADR